MLTSRHTPFAPRADARLIRATALLPVLIALAFGTASAQTWNESPDAGPLPASAQLTVGSGPLGRIDGSLSSDSDVDMYCIRVTDPASFIAALQCVVIQGPDIWLFRAAGTGVSANLLCQAGDKRVTGAFASTTGIYFLAVSYRGVSPVSGAGAIWLASNTAEHAPNGPGAAGAITSWSGTGNVQPLNPYRIVLSGAGFCDTPTSARAVGWGGLKRLYR